VFRLLIILAVIPIVVAFVARWWYGLRIISSVGRRQCSCDLEKWDRAFGSEHIPVSKSADALVYADLLRKSALADWRIRDSKASISREGARRFGMAVPPLAAMGAILGMIVGRIPITGVLAIFLTAIAVAVIISYLSIAPELKAILVTARRLRDSRVFPRRDDEEAVIQAASAIVWKEAAPPVFNLIQR
jgi:hypothetical protein